MISLLLLEREPEPTLNISLPNISNNYRAFTINISKLVVPRNIQEALDEPSWKLAVFEEMNALKKNGTWEAINLPREKKSYRVQMGVYNKE